jgi:hypothetical protein
VTIGGCLAPRGRRWAEGEGKFGRARECCDVQGGGGGGARTYGSGPSQPGARSGAADRWRLLDVFDAPQLRKWDGVEDGFLADSSEIDGVLGTDPPSGLPQAGSDRAGRVLASGRQVGGERQKLPIG